MNVAKVLENVRERKSGCDVSDERVITYIEAAEQLVMREIVRGRERETEVTAAYGGNDLLGDMMSDREHTLFAPSPFCGIYELYASAQIDLLCEDTERYLNDMAAFRDLFTDFKRWYWKMNRQKKDFNFSA